MFRRALVLSISLCSICLVSRVLASAQAPFVKTTCGVAPVEMPLWARLSEALSDEDIAKINLKAFAKGNKEAAWELGLAYMQGLGVPEDFAKAEQMFEFGAVDADKKGMVGMFYAHGYFPENLEAVERWYTAAGRPQDFFNLAEAFKAAGRADKSAAPRYYAKAITFYLAVLRYDGDPNVRLAQLELGDFVIDGIYSAGSGASGRARNLELARMIAQEMLGQKEFQSAVDYKIGQEDLPQDKAMWLRYCSRAAAYNIDNAQHAYVEALNDGDAHDFSGFDAVAWTRLNSQKMFADKGLLQAMSSSMTAHQKAGAEAAYQVLIKTRAQFGAYYSQDDPLRNPTPAALAEMDQDDPDVQLREAFNLESVAAHDERKYQNVLAVYRKVRDHSNYDFRFVLGRYALYGRNGVPKDHGVAEYWLREAIRSGSNQAQELLDQIEGHAHPD